MDLEKKNQILALENLSSLEIICHTQEIGLLTRSLICSKCNTDMKMKPFERSCDKFAWRCKKCRATKSVRAGSWFSRSHLPLQTILQITYLWCARKPSWLVRRELNIAQNTVIDWYNFCREICVEIILKNQATIGGCGVTVEIHVLKFEMLKFSRLKYLSGKFVFGGIERESDKSFMKLISNMSRETLVSLIERNVKSGTEIICNRKEIYELLGNAGLEYLKLYCRISFQDPEIEGSNLEDLWTRMKEILPDYNIGRGNFSSYLAEYMYRRSFEKESCLYSIFISDITKVYPLKVNEIDSWESESSEFNIELLSDFDPMWSS